MSNAKDANFQKSDAGEIRTQWANQPVALIPLSWFLGRKPRKILPFGASIALEGLIWRLNSWVNEAKYFS